MKIRIKGNFIRYRLTQSEVRKLADSGKLEEETSFGSGQNFYYALETKTGISGLEADFKNGRITLYLPQEAAHAWPDEDRVGFENTVETIPGKSLYLLLEKDFVCLDEVAEDQSDNYPNPRNEKRD